MFLVYKKKSNMLLIAVLWEVKGSKLVQIKVSLVNNALMDLTQMWLWVNTDVQVHRNLTCLNIDVLENSINILRYKE